MSKDMIAPGASLYRARARLAQAEAVVAAAAALRLRLAALFARPPAAKGDRALTIRRAWLRASA